MKTLLPALLLLTLAALAIPPAQAAEVPPEVCQAGFAQTWCDVSVGPCDGRLTPWTAWGDRYVVADCHVGGGAGATCHVESHTDDPANPEQWCAS